jgi:hypothetical protein
VLLVRSQKVVETFMEQNLADFGKGKSLTAVRIGKMNFRTRARQRAAARTIGMVRAKLTEWLLPPNVLCPGDISYDVGLVLKEPTKVSTANIPFPIT